MAPTNNDIAHDFPPFFKVYKDGTIEKYLISDHVSTCLDPKTGVQSKDVLISSDTNVKARIFIPKMDDLDRKLPLLVHVHAGGFSIGSAFDTPVNNIVSYLVSEAKVIGISIDYRLAPEHPLPIAYDDSWAGLQWISNHANGLGAESWLNEYADLGRVFLMGESAGANIVNHVAVRAGVNKLSGINIIGTLIVHPFFMGKEPDEMIEYIYPTSSGCHDDPSLNPVADPNLKSMCSRRVLVCVAEQDWLRNRGVAYYERLIKCGWGGKVELYVSAGADHCFHAFNFHSDKAKPLLQKLVDFVNQE